ncbi:monovalent cation/H(+) antiporter subunit G [Falsirhodobacter halotolerans]|uniref:monovalent cation/H(+) antiporter subunit G n=1 Tax=Falsirhodobacter halotolerans TaxID=1146892 RepID=UPI001FD1A3A5|nr:monovalent cation/H(+) antiporter subunit G [Falsirhodobacter halotolerans]MCJ8139206.1 monovalent cation/H(+) antiporter subunit G [Falsirhodobacter halotolerans]
MSTLPLWADILVSLLLLLGASLALIGGIGLLKLDTFYKRIHAPSIITCGATVVIVLASMLYFSVKGGRFTIHEILIAVFVICTTPVTLMLLGRAALYRDRLENRAPAVAKDGDTTRQP